MRGPLVPNWTLWWLLDGERQRQVQAFGRNGSANSPCRVFRSFGLRRTPAGPNVPCTLSF